MPDGKTPEERVRTSIKTTMLLSLILIRANKDPNLTDEEKAKDLEGQIDRLVDAAMSAIAGGGVTFVKREDVPAAFGNA